MTRHKNQNSKNLYNNLYQRNLELVTQLVVVKIAIPSELVVSPSGVEGLMKDECALTKNLGKKPLLSTGSVTSPTWISL